ncbi:MAG: flagellar biosynthesis protein FlhA [Spirochaetes bacterium]|nr:flagellar biosynthesis protein FlhA [Spirochaetota bacterium]
MAEKKSLLAKRTDVLLAVAVVAVIFMLIIPIPALMLDGLIAVNLMFSLVVILTVMYMKNAAEFSVFPSLLLMTTVFRLAINVSSTRMILTEGTSFDSKIIKAFGDFVVGGNYVVGIIIFLILVAVQFIVITKGSTRISEVAARFRLDAMPNKYMAVDGELASGMINEHEAMDRRSKIQAETDFYGSMDGASKFVKGDVTVGLLITFINIIGGIIVGTVMRGESMSVAAKTYILFTVGDGLVSQIPALLLSTATGIIVTRAVSDGGLGEDILGQLTSQPRVMFIAAGFLAFLGFLPGFPTIPLLLIAGAVVFLGVRLMASHSREEKTAEEIKHAEEGEPDVLSPLQPELLELEIGFALVPLVDESQGGDLLERVKNLRRRSANEMGIVVPPVRIRDNPRLSSNQYSIKIRGVEVGGGELQVDQFMVINPKGVPDGVPGIDTKDPTFGQDARWISRPERSKAEDLGYTVVDSPSVLATHLGELLKNYSPDLLTMQQVQKFIDSIESRAPAVVREIREKGSKLSDIQKVLQNLLRERVSISNMERILELIAENFEQGMKHEVLTEHVRQGLSMQISASHAEGKILKVVELDAELEEILSDSVDIDPEGNMTASIDPETLNLFIESATRAISGVNDSEYKNVVLCTAPNRIFVHQIFEKSLPSVNVISYNELSRNIQLQILGQISLEEEPITVNT